MKLIRICSHCPKFFASQVFRKAHRLVGFVVRHRGRAKRSGGRIWTAGEGKVIAPDIGVVALLAEACSDRGTLLLDDGTLVGNGLGGTHVADELLYCLRAKGSSAQAATRELRGRQGLGRGGRRTGTHRGGLCGSPLRAAWGSGKGQLDLHRWRGEAVEHTASVGCWKARLVRVAGGRRRRSVPPGYLTH